ncbi:MAG: hypothetical protein LBK76_06160 [Verrucomicrobiales bacterium]|jgi:hypothetical protein|nr:hypothetical protein [Verrucomicrobiales bacterium]
MRITYAGIELGDESPLRNLVSNFVPAGQVNVQWLQWLRATDAAPVPRGNRQRTVSFRLTFAPSQGAMALLTDFFDDLPDRGLLRWEENGFVRETLAVLQGYQPFGRRGETAGMDLAFAVNRPARLADGDWAPSGGGPAGGGGPGYDEWLDDGGVALTDEAGATLVFADED